MEPRLECIQGDPNPRDSNTYDYILKIFVVGDSPEVEVKVAISSNIMLDIFTETTPIEYHFSSNRYYIFYESLNKSSTVRAELYTNQYENSGIPFDKPSSGHSGSSGRGKFIRDPLNHIDYCGGDG